MQDVLQILGEESLQELKEVVAQLEAAEKLIIDINNAGSKFEFGTKGVKTFNDMAAAAKEVEANTIAMRQAAASYEKQATSIYNKLKSLSEEQQKVVISELKIQEEVRQSLQGRLALEASIKKATTASADSIKGMSQQLAALRREYDLLTKAEREDLKVGGERLKQIQALDDEIKQLEATTGRHQRNVGNYASAFNGLGSSVQQVAREMPAFANSMQTGFMAISNNLPMLADEISKTKDRIKQLKAEGKDAPSLFSQLAKATLSWQTLLVVGITLLTAFSDKIKDLFTWVKESIVGFNSLAEKTKLMNQAWEESSVKNAVADMMSLKGVIQLAKDGVISKTDAVELYNKTLGESAGKVKTLDEAEQFLVKNADKYIQYTMLKAAANKAFEKSADELVKVMEESSQKPSLLQNLIGSGIPGGVGGNVLQVTQIAKAADNANRFRKIAEDFQRQAFEIAKALNLSVTPVASSANRTSQKLQQLKEDLSKQGTDIYQQVVNIMNDVEEAQQDINSRSLAYLRTQLQQGLISLSQYEAAKKLIITNGEKQVLEEQMKILAQTLNNYSFNEENTTKITELWQNKRISLKKKEADADEEYLKSLAEHRNKFDKANDKSVKDAEQRQKEYIQSFAEMTRKAVEIFSSIGDVNANIYSQRISELEQINDLIDKNLQKEIDAIKAKGLTQKQEEEQIAIAKARAASQEEKNNKKIAEYRMRQAQLDKAIAIAGIIQNTSVAVMQFWSKGNIPLAIAAGIAGAAQVAAVASRPLPKYEKGTNDSEGGAAIVSEKGQELVIEPDGTQWLTPEKQAVVMLKKHSKVIPHHKLMEMHKSDALNMALLPVSEGAQFDDRKIVEALVANQMGIKAVHRELEKANAMAQKQSRYPNYNFRSGYYDSMYR